MAAIKIGLHRAAVADLHVVGRFAQGEHLDAKFMAQNARVREKRLATVERMNICAAHPNSSHSHAGFAWLQGGWRIGLKRGQPAWFFETNRLHGQ